MSLLSAERAQKRLPSGSHHANTQVLVSDTKSSGKTQLPGETPLRGQEREMPKTSLERTVPRGRLCSATNHTAPRGSQRDRGRLRAPSGQSWSRCSSKIQLDWITAQSRK